MVVASKTYQLNLDSNPGSSPSLSQSPLFGFPTKMIIYWQYRKALNLKYWGSSLISWVNE